MIDIALSTTFNLCIFGLLNNWEDLNLKQVKRLDSLFVELDSSVNIPW